MQTISLKIADNIIIRIDDAIEKHNYSTRSEFIRDALRDKLEKLENQKFESEIRDYLNVNKKNVGLGKNKDLAGVELEMAKNDIFYKLERKFDELRERSEKK